MNWEISRHDWTSISETLQDVPDLLSRLFTADSLSAANQAYWKLDSLLVPNQVLQAGSPETASCLIQLLPEAPGAARLWALELLAQFSAGMVGPTAAEPAIVDQMRTELPWVIPQAAQLLQYGNEPECFLSLDILENCYEYAPHQRSRIGFLFDRFAQRGGQAEERVRVSTVPTSWRALSPDA